MNVPEQHGLVGSWRGLAASAEVLHAHSGRVDPMPAWCWHAADTTVPCLGTHTATPTADNAQILLLTVSPVVQFTLCRMIPAKGCYASFGCQALQHDCRLRLVTVAVMGCSCFDKRAGNSG